MNHVLIIVQSAVYVVLAAGLLLRWRRRAARTARDGVVTPFGELEKAATE